MYLINQMSSLALNDYRTLSFSSFPSINLPPRVFGSACSVRNLTLDKLSTQSFKCVFMGYLPSPPNDFAIIQDASSASLQVYERCL